MYIFDDAKQKFRDNSVKGMFKRKHLRYMFNYTMYPNVSTTLTAAPLFLSRSKSIIYRNFLIHSFCSHTTSLTFFIHSFLIYSLLSQNQFMYSTWDMPNSVFLIQWSWNICSNVWLLGVPGASCSFLSRFHLSHHNPDEHSRQSMLIEASTNFIHFY